MFTKKAKKTVIIGIATTEAIISDPKTIYYILSFKH